MSWKEKLLFATVPWLGAQLIRGLYYSMRVEFLGEEGVRELWERGENVILAFWHEQTLMMAKSYRGPGAKLLISQSKDGELLAKAMTHFGYEAIRGSSSRGGRSAFKEMLSISKEPFDLALTPDGPRGPRRELKDGVVQLARLGGRAVVPLAFCCNRGHRFSSWDRFLLPYPFARAVYRYGEPVYFDKDAGVADFRDRLAKAMMTNLRAAEKHLEAYGLPAV
ncbi:lysophospholipid acyltransferase family protein [Pelobacter seleniigenes]|uniref:lysophospholipid acyltransferase family protein n=1 Tax=Pelobacter seleniigenes TaxID=407188 RepID=UPI0004A6FF12|nr:lysophospholipid acyltransferase family protein [Pelobacter seleniigenes]